VTIKSTDIDTLPEPSLPATLDATPTLSEKSSPVEDGRIRSGKLAGQTMWRAIWLLSWPVLVESFCQAMVGMVDTTLAAGISEAVTDGIGAASYIGWLIGLVGISLGVGATAMISRAMGRGRLGVGGAVVGQCVLLSLLGGTVAGLMLFLAAPMVSSWMSLEGQALDAAVTYLCILALGVPSITILSTGIAACRGAGDSVVPLVVMVSINVINIALSLLLSGVDVAVSRIGPDGELIRRVIFENPTPFDMGIAGIATGTVIAWTIGALMVTWALVRGVHGLKLRARRLRPHWHTIRRLLRIGVPNLLESVGMWAGNFITIMLVGWMRNPGYLGTHIVAVRIEAFSYLPGFAMAVAAATLTGQYLGAGSPKLARLAAVRCCVLSSIIMGLFGIAFWVVPGPIVGLFTQQEVHLALAPKLLMVCALVQIPFALAITTRSAMRGAGDTKGVLWITWLSTWGIRLPLAWLLCGVEVPLPGGGSIPNPAPLQRIGVDPLVGFWIGLCAELVLRAGLFMWRFVRDDWLKVRV